MTFEEALDKNGTLVYTNVGVSMMPLLRENRDYMVITKRSSERLKRYDAVLFVRPNVEGRGHYVLHRILKVYDDRYWIVGDNCRSGEMVREEEVLGVLTTVIRDGKPLDFNSFGYKCYVYLWCAPYHFRFLCLGFRRFLGRCVRFVLRRLPWKRK